MAAAKYNVLQAMEFLSKFPSDADVRGFNAVKVVPRPVPVKAAKEDKPAVS